MKRFNILVWFENLSTEKKVSSFEFLIIIVLCWVIRHQNIENRASYDDGKVSTKDYNQRMKECDSEKIRIQTDAYGILFERKRISDSIHNEDQKEIQDLLRQRISIVDKQNTLFNKTLKK